MTQQPLPEATSPEAARQHALRVFLATMARPCTCPVELRAEGGALRCARCDLRWLPRVVHRDLKPVDMSPKQHGGAARTHHVPIEAA